METSDTTKSGSFLGSPTCREAHADSSIEFGSPHPISYLRFLISNAGAGSVIGKGGATINEFQSQSGAKIQLSRNHEYFPGTTDRIIMLSGTVEQILSAFESILTKIYSEAEESKPKANQVKLIIPHIVCGAIIGKGGSTIRSFVKESNANIKLSSPGDLIPGIQDRLVTVAGSLAEQVKAVALIVKKISEDANYLQYASAPSTNIGKSLWGLPQHFQGPYTAIASVPPFTYGSNPYNCYSIKGMMTPFTPEHGAPLPVRMPVLAASPSTFMVMGVRDEWIGAIIGRDGKTISDIQQMSGVHIKISDQGDFLAGTTNRKLTITGSPDSIYAAQQLILQKISQCSMADHTR